MISLSNRKICFLPFFAGINCSTVSVNKSSPTLSLFLIAENPKIAAISAAISQSVKFGYKKSVYENNVKITKNIIEK